MYNIGARCKAVSRMGPMRYSVLGGKGEPEVGGFAPDISCGTVPPVLPCVRSISCRYLKAKSPDFTKASKICSSLSAVLNLLVDVKGTFSRHKPANVNNRKINRQDLIRKISNL